MYTVWFNLYKVKQAELSCTAKGPIHRWYNHKEQGNGYQKSGIGVTFWEEEGRCDQDTWGSSCNSLFDLCGDYAVSTYSSNCTYHSYAFL